jgi:hypothetical protein
MTENHRQTFRLSCLSSAIQLVVPPTCELLARLRSAATWDEASIHLAERDFPRVHIRCHLAGTSMFTVSKTSNRSDDFS